MDKTEYLAIQEKLFQLAEIVGPLDLKGFLEAIELTESTGPFIDPTLYRDGIDNLEIIKRLAEGARSLQKACPTPEERGRMLLRIAQHHERQQRL